MSKSLEILNLLNESITVTNVQSNALKWAKLVSARYSNITGNFHRIRVAETDDGKPLLVVVFEKVLLCGFINNNVSKLTHYVLAAKFRSKPINTWKYDSQEDTFTAVNARSLVAIKIPENISSAKQLAVLITPERKELDLSMVHGDDYEGDMTRAGYDITQDQIDIATSTPEAIKRTQDFYRLAADRAASGEVVDSKGKVNYFKRGTVEAELYWSLRPFNTKEVACEKVKKILEKEIKNLNSTEDIDQTYEMLYGADVPTVYTHETIENPEIINLMDNYIKSYVDKLKQKLGNHKKWVFIEQIMTWYLKTRSIDKEISFKLPYSDEIDTYMDAIRQEGYDNRGQDTNRQPELYKDNFLEYLARINNLDYTLEHTYKIFVSATKEILPKLEVSDFQIKFNTRGGLILESRSPISLTKLADKYYRILMGANVVFDSEEIRYLVPLSIALNKKRRSDIYDKLIRRYGRSAKPIYDYSIKIFDDLSNKDKTVRKIINVLIGSIIVTTSVVTESILYDLSDKYE